MDNFFKALEILMARIQGIDFALLGTFNLFLQGIKVKPHDLDLITDNEGINKIANIFESKTINKNSYLETGFLVGGVEVHVVSNEKNPLRGPFRDSVVWVYRKHLRIPCLSLKSELTFYQKACRSKDRGKIELINNNLSRKV